MRLFHYGYSIHYLPFQSTHSLWNVTHRNKSNSSRSRFQSTYSLRNATELLYKKDITAKDRKTMEFYLQKAKKEIVNTNRDEKEQREIILTIRHFVRFYEFLIQVTCFQDTELHKKYNFCSYLQSYLKMTPVCGLTDVISHRPKRSLRGAAYAL